MICFITDFLREGEPDILSSVKHETLVIRSLEGRLIELIAPPPAGWSHAALEKQAARLAPRTRMGADAYLGASWVGGTEV
ncbi:hypothetical protein FGL86_05705 [Pistricoccus aurantiacus]|uniref:Uncharacterized protein n=1 Tax=Pistricoccus aurantiacus TaxID=1883414 RepID=A0A5B8SUI9_9GAMM|nr:hypothetical protein FGL86_05705 [Pistricoccus aurantiacus]